MERFITFETPTAQGTPKSQRLEDCDGQLKNFSREKKSKAQKGKEIKKIQDVNDKYQWSPYIESFLKFISSFDSSSRAISFSFNFGELWIPQKFRSEKFFSAWLLAEVSPHPGGPQRRKSSSNWKHPIFDPQKMEKKSSINLVKMATKQF